MQDADLDTTEAASRHGRRAASRPASGGDLPAGGRAAALYLPAGAEDRPSWCSPISTSILKYNNAASYALAVGLLADRMVGRPGADSWPRDEQPCRAPSACAFQTDLAAWALTLATPDGVLGRKTRAALRQYQAAHGLIADAYPTVAMLALLDTDASKVAPNQ